VKSLMGNLADELLDFTPQCHHLRWLCDHLDGWQFGDQGLIDAITVALKIVFPLRQDAICIEYGAGDGQPIRNIPKLSEVSGVHVETLRKYLPEWEKEAEELLANTSELGLAIHLSAEKIALAEQDEIFVRDQINSIKWEIENLDDLTVLLQNLTEKFCDDDDMRREALTLFNAWLQGAGKKSLLRTQFIAMKKLWDEKTGLDALRDIGATRQRELAKGKAKLEVKAMENEPRSNSERLVGGGVFARPARNIEG